MKLTALRLLAATTICGLGGGAAAAQSCSRACLEDVLNKYLAAVVKHDAAANVIGAGYRETDNAIVTAAGQGVWKTMTALGKVQRHYMDPVNQSVGFFGTIDEGGQGGIATLRLLVEDRKVIEAEWIIGRQDTGTPMAPGPGATSVEGQEQTPPPTSMLPKAKRVPRRVMVAAVNAYFDMAQTGAELPWPEAPEWVRLENGVGTGKSPGGSARGGKGMWPGLEAARRANAVQGGVPAAPPIAARDVCSGICNVAARRYPIIDEEAGVVLGIVVFQRPPANAFRRNLLSEWFTFDGGKINGIYASMEYMKPTFAAPNWAPYDGNFPTSFNVGISPIQPPPGTPMPAGPGGPGGPQPATPPMPKRAGPGGG